MVCCVFFFLAGFATVLKLFLDGFVEFLGGFAVVFDGFEWLEVGFGLLS